MMGYHLDNGTLKNKYGIEDKQVLREFEYQATDKRAIELKNGTKQLDNIKFDLERLKEIHKHIFGDLYEWAGKARTVPSSKRAPMGSVSVFSEPEQIKEKWSVLSVKTQAFVDMNKNTPLNEKAKVLSDIFAEANHIHPFVEGNGRSLQVFMEQLAEKQAVKLDYSKTNAQEWADASSSSGVHGRLFEGAYLIPNPINKKPIRQIFSKMASDMEKVMLKTPQEHHQEQLAVAFLKAQTGDDYAALKKQEPSLTPAIERLYSVMEREKAEFAKIGTLEAKDKAYSAILTEKKDLIEKIKNGEPVLKPVQRQTEQIKPLRQKI